MSALYVNFLAHCSVLQATILVVASSNFAHVHTCNVCPCLLVIAAVGLHLVAIFIFFTFMSITL